MHVKFFRIPYIKDSLHNAFVICKKSLHPIVKLFLSFSHLFSTPLSECTRVDPTGSVFIFFVSDILQLQTVVLWVVLYICIYWFWHPILMYGNLSNFTKQWSQLWTYLPKDGIRFHWLRAQSHKTSLTSDASCKLRLLPVFLTYWL